MNDVVLRLGGAAALGRLGGPCLAVAGERVVQVVRATPLQLGGGELDRFLTIFSKFS